jgi:hypothetical protein
VRPALANFWDAFGRFFGLQPKQFGTKTSLIRLPMFFARLRSKWGRPERMNFL